MQLFSTGAKMGNACFGSLDGVVTIKQSDNANVGNGRDSTADGLGRASALQTKAY